MEVVTRKARLENAIGIGDWLVEKSREDPVIIFEVKTKIFQAVTSVEDLSMTLSTFKSKAQGWLLSEQEFTEMTRDLEAKFDRIEAQLGLLDPVSARYTVARQQQEHFRPLFVEVQQLRDFQDAISTARGFGKESVEESPANAKIMALTERWKTAWNVVANYHLQITSVLPFEERHHYAMRKLMPVIDECEKKLENLQGEVRPSLKRNIHSDIKVLVNISNKNSILYS